MKASFRSLVALIGVVLSIQSLHARSKFERPSASELAKAFSQAGGKADHDVLNGLTNSTPKEGISVTRPVDGANPCFPRTVLEVLSKTTQGRTTFPIGMRRIAALSAGDPEFAKQLETQIGFWRANAGDRDAVDPAEMLSLLISPEMGLDQKQVAKALEVYRGILASNTSRTEEQSGNEALQAAGVPKNFIPLLRKINEPDGVERLMKLAKVEEVSLSQLLVWMSDPLLPVPSEKVLKDMESAIDKTAAKDLAKAFRKNLEEQAKNVIDEQAVKDALAGWDKNFSQADVEKLGMALRQLQKVDARPGSKQPSLSALVDLGKEAGFYELLPKVLEQTAGDACFLNDHTASRTAKLEPLEKQLAADRKTKAKEKFAETKATERSEAAAAKREDLQRRVLEKQKKVEETGDNSLIGLQDMVSGFARRLLNTPTVQKLEEMKRQQSSTTQTKAEENGETPTDKGGQAAPPADQASGEQLFPASLTAAEIDLLKRAVPTLVFWDGDQPNPKLESIKTAMEQIAKGNEKDAAAAVARFLGTLDDEKRKKLGEVAGEELKKAGLEPRHRWLAERLAWGAGILNKDADAIAKNKDFTREFNAQWEENKKAGAKFYQLIADMDGGPEKRLAAVRALQNSYDKEAAVKWASLHYGSKNPLADKAAKKFMEALMSDANGVNKGTLVEAKWVNGQKELVSHDLSAESPQGKWEKIRNLAGNRFTYEPPKTTQSVATNPPPVTPPTQPTQPVNDVATNTRLASAALTGKCTSCHKGPAPSGGVNLVGADDNKVKNVLANIQNLDGMLSNVGEKSSSNPNGLSVDEIAAIRFFAQKNGGQLAGNDIFGTPNVK